MNLEQARGFVAVVEHGSIAAAAASLGMSRPTLSRHLAAFEVSLGLAVLHRSTRAVGPTVAGQELYEALAPLLVEAQRVEARFTREAREVTGWLRVSVPPALAGEVAAVLRDSGDPFFSGQTYACIPLAAAVGLAVLDRIEGDHLVQRAGEVGGYLKEKLTSLLDHPHVGDVRGEGLFLGVEFVADKESREPLDASWHFSKKVEAAALQHGLVTLGARGTVEHIRGDHMLFAPPLTLTYDHADELVAALRLSIDDALRVCTS